jgi:hypothetical protein
MNDFFIAGAYLNAAASLYPRVRGWIPILRKLELIIFLAYFTSVTCILVLAGKDAYLAEFNVENLFA